MMLTKEILDALAADFPENILQCKAQVYAPKGSNASNAEKCMMVTYVSHTDVAARLDDVCSRFALDWDFAQTREWHDGEGRGLTYYVEGILSLKRWMPDGSTQAVYRVGVGEGGDPKSAYSDALKRAAVLYGVGRSLYEQDNMWIPWQSNYQYKKFSLQEVKELVGQGRKANSTTAQQSQSRANNTVKQLNEGGQQTAATGGFDPVDNSITTGLWQRLGATTAEDKKRYYTEFGENITPQNHKRFNEFLQKKVEDKVRR